MSIMLKMRKLSVVFDTKERMKPNEAKQRGHEDSCNTKKMAALKPTRVSGVRLEEMDDFSVSSCDKRCET